jgi:type 1 glutamine amidotransferase
MATLDVCDPIDPTFAGAAGRPLRVCLVSGCPQYESDGTLSALEKYLQKYLRKYLREYLQTWDDVHCIRVFSRRGDDLSGLEHLDESDCMLLFARRLTVGGEQLERVKRYCRRGGAVVGVRTASHAFENWPEMDTEVFGGDYQGHYGNRLTEVQLLDAARGHPVLTDVEPFASRGSLCKNRRLAEDATVLLCGTLPGQTHPVAWARPHCGGRVFYTSLGHPLDWRQPSFLRLLANAVSWTCAGDPA